MAGPFEHVLTGLKVLDFTRALAGPTVTRMFAEMGAQVIKVESAPNGDLTRRMSKLRNERSLYYVQQNLGYPRAWMGYLYLAAADVNPKLVEGRNLDWSRLAILGRQPPWLQELLAAHAEALSVVALRKVVAAARQSKEHGPTRAGEELQRQLTGAREDAQTPKPRSVRGTRISKAAETILGVLQKKGIAGLDVGIRAQLAALWEGLGQAGLGAECNRLHSSENINDFKEEGQEQRNLNTQASAPPELPGRPAAANGSSPLAVARERGAHLDDVPDAAGPGDASAGSHPILRAITKALIGKPSYGLIRLHDALSDFVVHRKLRREADSRYDLTNRLKTLAKHGALPATLLNYLFSLMEQPTHETRWPLLLPLLCLMEHEEIRTTVKYINACDDEIPAAILAAVRATYRKIPAYREPDIDPAEERADNDVLRNLMDEAEQAFLAVLNGQVEVGYPHPAAQP